MRCCSEIKSDDSTHFYFRWEAPDKQQWHQGINKCGPLLVYASARVGGGEMIKVIEGCGWSIVWIRGRLDKCNCRSAMRLCGVLDWKDDSYFGSVTEDACWISI